MLCNVHRGLTVISRQTSPGTNLSGANFDDAVLGGADLTHAICQFSMAMTPGVGALAAARRAIYH
jgi:uncharacterized protein YjbI with pentapeptide repeats